MADIEEKRASGVEIDVNDYVMVGADIGVAGVGGKILKKSIGTAIGTQIGNDMIIDIAMDVSSSGIYETLKSDDGGNKND